MYTCFIVEGPDVDMDSSICASSCSCFELFAWKDSTSLATVSPSTSLPLVPHMGAQYLLLLYKTDYKDQTTYYFLLVN